MDRSKTEKPSFFAEPGKTSFPSCSGVMPEGEELGGGLGSEETLGAEEALGLEETFGLEEISGLEEVLGSEETSEEEVLGPEEEGRLPFTVIL